MVSNVSIWRTILGYKRTVSDLASLWTRFLLFRCILWRGAIGCWFLIGAWCALIGVCVVIRSVFLTHCGVGVHIDKKVIYLSFRNPDVNYVWTALWLGSTCSRSSFIPPHIFYLLTHSCIHLPPPPTQSINAGLYLRCFLMHGLIETNVSSCYSQMVIQDESFSSPFTPLSPLGWKGANNTYFFDLLINYKLVTRCSCRHWS